MACVAIASAKASDTAPGGSCCCRPCFPSSHQVEQASAQVRQPFVVLPEQAAPEELLPPHAAPGIGILQERRDLTGTPYALKRWRPFFPGMTSQSPFNRRVRRLWGAFILLQLAISDQLTTADDREVLDCVPGRVAHGAPSLHSGWLGGIAAIGKGGTERYFYGLHLLLVVSASGLPTGWTLAVGNVQERWLAELLLSARAGQAQLSGPQTGEPRVAPPPDWIGPVQSCGTNNHRLIIGDPGYDGQFWRGHWAQDYAAQVVTLPSEMDHPWFGALRQVVETAFANLCGSFGLQYPGAHTAWGLITHIAARSVELVNSGCSTPIRRCPTGLLAEPHP